MFINRREFHYMEDEIKRLKKDIWDCDKKFRELVNRHDRLLKHLGIEEKKINRIDLVDIVSKEE